MKKIISLSFICALLFGFSSVSYAGPDVNIEKHYFDLKFWMEKYHGGGPGQIGNVLLAVGNGFKFNHATIADPPVIGSILCGDPGWVTEYVGGDLILTKGPWLNKGMLKALNVEATNRSGLNSDGKKCFNIWIRGDFEGGNYHFDAEVSWTEDETNYEELPGVFQRGTDPKDAWIEIVEITP